MFGSKRSTSGVPEKQQLPSTTKGVALARSQSHALPADVRGVRPVARWPIFYVRVAPRS